MQFNCVFEIFQRVFAKRVVTKCNTHEVVTKKCIKRTCISNDLCQITTVVLGCCQITQFTSDMIPKHIVLFQNHLCMEFTNN